MATVKNAPKYETGFMRKTSDFRPGFNTMYLSLIHISIADADIAETFNADVVVVGAGMAGTCCAVSAAEGGLSVILIDAGTKAISRGGSNQAIGTKYQKEMGIDYTPKEDVYKRQHQEPGVREGGAAEG